MRMRLLCVRCVTRALGNTAAGIPTRAGCRKYFRVCSTSISSRHGRQSRSDMRTEYGKRRARARVRVGHNTHSSCDNAPRCFRVLRVHTLLSLGGPPRGSLECAHRRIVLPDHATHQLALHEAAEGNFLESRSTARSETCTFSPLHLSECRIEITGIYATLESR